MALSSRLMCLTILVLASHVMLSSAAVSVSGLKASGLKGDPGNPPDAFVRVSCGSSKTQSTEIIKGTTNPSWTKRFSFSSCSIGQTLLLEVWDKDVKYDDYLGNCRVTVKKGTSGPECSLPKGKLTFDYSAK